MSDLRVCCERCDGHFWARAEMNGFGRVRFVNDPHACTLGPWPLPSFVPPDNGGWAESDVPTRAPMVRLCRGTKHQRCGTLVAQPKTGGRTLRCPDCQRVQTRAYENATRKKHPSRSGSPQVKAYRRRYYQEKGA